MSRKTVQENVRRIVTIANEEALKLTDDEKTTYFNRVIIYIGLAVKKPVFMTKRRWEKLTKCTVMKYRITNLENGESICIQRLVADNCSPAGSVKLSSLPRKRYSICEI